jgi:large subunit ribosomal protein L10
MARPDKVDAVEEMRDKFRNSNGAVVTAYTGLTVAQLQQLRRSLGENAQYRVAKNTLTKIAANEAGITAIDDLFTGSSAVAFVTGDPVEAAKGLRDFAKDNPNLVIKGGVLDGKALSADEIKKLADLESREVLLSKLAVPGCLRLPGAAVEARPHRGRAPCQAGRAGRCRVTRLASRPPLPERGGRRGPVVRPPHMYIRHLPI